MPKGEQKRQQFSVALQGLCTWEHRSGLPRASARLLPGWLNHKTFFFKLLLLKILVLLIAVQNHGGKRVGILEQGGAFLPGGGHDPVQTREVMGCMHSRPRRCCRLLQERVQEINHYFRRDISRLYHIYQFVYLHLLLRQVVSSKTLTYWIHRVQQPILLWWDQCWGVTAPQSSRGGFPGRGVRQYDWGEMCVFGAFVGKSRRCCCGLEPPLQRGEVASCLWCPPSWFPASI